MRMDGQGTDGTHPDGAHPDGAHPGGPHRGGSTVPTGGEVGFWLGLAVLWVALAWRSPGTTYHLAPIAVAGGLALSRAWDRAVPLLTVVRLAMVGTAVALAATVVLMVGDRLRGPSLLPIGDAAFEAFVFSLLGGAAVVVVGLVLRR